MAPPPRTGAGRHSGARGSSPYRTGIGPRFWPGASGCHRIWPSIPRRGCGSYALDDLGGRIVRARGDGAVEPFAERLTRPAALAVLADGVVVVAEDTGRLLRIFGAPQVPQ